MYTLCECTTFLALKNNFGIFGKTFLCWLLGKVWCERLSFSHVFCSNKNAQFSWKYLSRFGQRKNPFHLFLKDLYCALLRMSVVTTFLRTKQKLKLLPTKVIF